MENLITRRIDAVKVKKQTLSMRRDSHDGQEVILITIHLNLQLSSFSPLNRLPTALQYPH